MPLCDNVSHLVSIPSKLRGWNRLSSHHSNTNEIPSMTVGSPSRSARMMILLLYFAIDESVSFEKAALRASDPVSGI